MVSLLPDLPNARNAKTKKMTIEWAGLDKRLAIADNSLSAASNMSTKCSPYLSPRSPRTSSYTLVSGNALFASTKLAWVDGTDWKYDGTTKGNVTAGAKSMVELSGRIVVFPDKKSYDTVAGGTLDAFGSGTYPAAGSVPDIDYACTLDNRIWGVKGDNIYCCALGDFDNWATFSSPSEATDAWSVDTGTLGDFTGICSYKGYNLAFKADRVFKRFGDIPENFQFIDTYKVGCLSHKSIVEVNKRLFWLSKQGVVMYTGGEPEIISEELNDTYISAVAGGDDRRYYISLYNGSTYTLYTYDTWKGLWQQEDSLNVKEFAYYGGYLYALASDNKIWKLNYGTETVTWSATTKEYTEEVDNKKGHSELFLRVNLAASSSISVYTKLENGSFVLKKTYSTAGKTTVTVPLKIQRADRFTVKIDGAGEAEVREMVRKFYYGSNA